jgi:hypothetical protein
VTRLPAATGAASARCGHRPWPVRGRPGGLEGDLASKVQALASDPKDGLAAALARLGRAFMARND